MEKLAIDGGKPVRQKPLNYGRQSVDEEDIQAVVSVLRSDFLTMGPTIPAFERTVAEYVGAKYAVAVNSGTAALHAAAHAAKIGPGDDVIISLLTFAASSNCVLYQGGTPVFADVLPDTLNIDPEDVERRITPRTKAIVAVDFTGLPCDYEALRAIARKQNLVIIEDAAHALGATYKDQKVGTINELTTFSFHPVKHITTGEGGMIVTDDREMAVRMRNFRSQGVDLDFRARTDRVSWFYEVVDLGFNYRMPDLGAALGMRQMQKLDAWLTRRRAIAKRYMDAFANMPEIIPPAVKSENDSAWHLYLLRLNLNLLSVGRREVFKALHAEGLGVNVHYIPVPWHPYYQQMGFRKGDWPVGERAYEQIISIPIFPAMAEDDVEDVISAVRKVVVTYRK
jgi:UDP-4-amino-4,6-dideoxy-N-acetyl-beta-L-altrosamine transaminase